MRPYTSGAANDIENATNIARNMVTRYGMSDKVGPMSFGSDHNEVFLGRDLAAHQDASEALESLIDSEIKKLLDDAYAKATQILTEHKAQLEKVASYLVEREKLSEAEFKKILAGEELSSTSDEAQKETQMKDNPTSSEEKSENTDKAEQ